jgi:predicted RNase H-like nuclease (RuvC/YqgF family)
MFGFGKRKEESETAAVESTSIAEEMGLKEYVSFDSVKAHLVDILEENRKLKQEKEDQKERIYKLQQEDRKQKELALIEADEWKKRAKEKDEEIKKLKATINEQDKTVEKLEKQNNSLKTEAEMARTEEENTRKRYREKEDCNIWLKRSLEQKLGRDWDKVTKTQLVDILKTILDESKVQQ